MALCLGAITRSLAAETYYQILGVPENATQEEIRKAYRRVIKRTHPDLNYNVSREESDALRARTQEINHARDVLLDDIQRSKYDADLRMTGEKHPGVQAYETAECLVRSLKRTLDIRI